MSFCWFICHELCSCSPGRDTKTKVKLSVVEKGKSRPERSLQTIGSCTGAKPTFHKVARHDVEEVSAADVAAEGDLGAAALQPLHGHHPLHARGVTGDLQAQSRRHDGASDLRGHLLAHTRRLLLFQRDTSNAS